MLRPFALHRPDSEAEACALLARLGEDATAYAGGTELLLLMKEGLLRPRHLVDLKGIPGLDAITADDRRLAIGATVTHRRLERSDLVRARWPLIASAARHVANVRVRNVGTVGGNLAFADPHSDLATLFLALDARVELRSPRGQRELGIAEFVRGPWETAREPDELLSRVLVPVPSEALGAPTNAPSARRTAAAYVKFGMHERPTLGIAVILRVESPGTAEARIAEARIAIGCVDLRPIRLPGAEAPLRSCALRDVEDAGRQAALVAAEQVDPGDDLHGSADYKREMVAVFMRRAVLAAAARSHGGEPAVRYPYAVVA